MTNPLTSGNILKSLFYFALPVMFTLFLQAMYGGADLIVVGQFASTSDISAVSTVSMIIHTITMLTTAGIGIAEKVCAFVMLVPSSYMQSVAAFTAQNVGARQYDRARKALYYAIGTSIGIGIFIAMFTYFKGNLLTEIFTNEEVVILASHDYLKAYAIDTLLTSFMFCFIGYFDGFGYTKFVMLQGIIGSLIIRIPVAYFISMLPDCSLFAIGLATPTASFFQILMCTCFFVCSKKYR